MGCTNSIREGPNIIRPHSNMFSSISIDDNFLPKKKSAEEEFKINTNTNKQEETNFHTTSIETNDTIIIKCDCHESLLMKWFRKDEIIHFEVKGKWRPDPTLPECDSKGFNSYLMNDYNYGSLVGRILSSSTFQINNNTTYKVNSKGPLLLKMNSPRSNLNSKGELLVKVYGGEDISFQSLNTKTGWNINSICSKINNYLLNYLEEELFITVHKIRCNPKLFADQFITSNPLLHKDFISNDKKSFTLITFNEVLYSTLVNFKKEITIRRTSSSANSSPKYESLLRVTLKNNNIDISKCQFIVKQMKERNSHKIMMHLLMIEQFLLSLFDETTSSMLIKSFFIENTTIIILIFVK